MSDLERLAAEMDAEMPRFEKALAAYEKMDITQRTFAWPQTQVHREYDPAAAKERLRVANRGQIVGYSWPAYDPYRPRVLDHRQAEQMPWIVEALLTLLIAAMVIAILIVAALSPRG